MVNTVDLSQQPTPNIVVFGIGHSGTTVLAKVLHALGWKGGDADFDYAESVVVRSLNERALHGQFEATIAECALATFPRPFAIKDPRFVHTLDLWLPVFRPYEPLLLWITRDPAALVESYRRGDWVLRARGGTTPPETIRLGMTLEEISELARAKFERWPWNKLSLSYENLLAAAELVRPRPVPAVTSDTSAPS